MFDKMAIRKQLERDGKKFVGYVDVGVETDNQESLPMATEALVIMAVSMNGVTFGRVVWLFFHGKLYVVAS